MHFFNQREKNQRGDRETGEIGVKKKKNCDKTWNCKAGAYLKNTGNFILIQCGLTVIKKNRFSEN